MMKTIHSPQSTVHRKNLPTSYELRATSCILVALFLACLILPITAQAATYYVFFLNGNDANPGTEAAPFRTIHKGIDIANSGDTVNVGIGNQYNFQYFPIDENRIKSASKPTDSKYLKKGVLDVTLFKADLTGQRDSTVEIQTAVTIARDYKLVAFFPNQANGERGVYLISDTIKCFQADLYQGDTNFMKPNVLLGSTKGAGRPIIKLQNNTAKFSDSTNPVPLVRFWAPPGVWASKEHAGSDDPQYCEDDESFDQIFQGIDIDLGNNPGAYGIRHPGAQGSAIEDVRIDATGAFAGLGKFGVEGWAAYNVEVEGGRYAVYGVPDGDKISPYNGHGILIGCTFKNQEKAVFLFGNSPLPLILAGFHIVRDKGALNIGNLYCGAGGISLVDGVIEMNGGGVFDDSNANNKFYVKYMRNVYVKGADSVVNGWNIDNKNNWTQIKEYEYNDPNNSNARALIDGVISSKSAPFEYKSKVENVNVTQSQLINSLVKKHLWDEASFPSFEDSDAIDVKEMGEYSAKGDGIADDTAALKYAIEHYDKIFLSKGRYMISDTLTLKSNTQLFGLGVDNSEIRPHSSWKPSGETIILNTVDDKNAKTILAFLSVNTDQYLEIPGPDGFTPIQWRTGRKSMTRNVMAGAFSDQWYPTFGYLNYHRFRINGGGGGRHWSLLGRCDPGGYLNKHHLFIEGTKEPLYVYAFNGENPGELNVVIKNASNINIYGQYDEGGTISIDHSENTSIISSALNTHGEVGSDIGGIEAIESNNVLVADYAPVPIVSKRIALKEIYGGEEKAAIGATVALFKRGDPGFDSILLYGDVSEDGIISAYDAALTAQAAVGLITLTTAQTQAADVSGDGQVTAYDAALIAQRAVGLISKFPVEP